MIIEGLIILFLLLVFLFSGVPVALSMALSGITGLLIFVGPQILFDELGRVIWWSLYDWLLIAVPLFLLMAEFLGRSGISEMLFEGLAKFTAGLRGTLAMAAVIGCALFGLTTGSGIAEIATIGRLSVPSMLKRGYEPKLALGSVAAAGSLGFLIPPSIFLVIYGSWAQISIGRLFAAGLIPGFLVAGFMIISVIIQVTLRPQIAPISASLPVKERIKGLSFVWPVVALGAAILGSIFAGIATPTEAAGVGVLAALCLALVRPRSRKLVNWQYFKDSILTTVKLTSAMLFILVGAKILTFFWSYVGIPVFITQWVAGLAIPSLATLALLYLIMLFFGCLMDGISLMVFTLPFVLPIIETLGYDPIWYGVILGVLIGCAQITPPVGIGLYTVKAIFPEFPFMSIVRGAMPFLLAEIAVLLFLTAFPAISLWLPNLIYG